MHSQPIPAARPLARAAALFATVFATATASTAAQAVQCLHEVVDEWPDGYKAEITIVNDGPPLQDWSLNWSWADGSQFREGWNARYACGAQACTATPPDWQPTIATGAQYTFGYINDKTGAPADRNVVVAGAICDGNNGGGGTGSTRWTLDGQRSTLHYVSVKKEHTAENNHFAVEPGEEPALSGSIDAAGQARLALDLNDVATGVEIRDSRLLALLFETEFLPTAYIQAQVDMAQLDALQPGDLQAQTIALQLSIHGVGQTLQAPVLISRVSATELQVSSVAPVLVDAKRFDMDAGIEALRVVANLSSIGEAVPVYFHLVYAAAEAGATPLALPPAPAAPDYLNGYFDADNGTAELAWLDNSENESLFLVRRRVVGGRWATTAELPANSSALSEGLPEAAEYDYKVIALNGSMPSAPSGVLTIAVQAGNPIVRGHELYQNQCAGCHGENGEGSADFPALNTARDLESMINTIETTMPRGNPQSCDRQCAEDVAAYIQTLWMADVVCDTGRTPVRYGARQLKLLTRSEYQRSIEDLLGVDFDAASGLSEDAKVGLFTNNTHHAVSPASYSNALLVAEEVAQWSAARDFDPALSCASYDSACADRFVAKVAPRIMRRPLEAAEVGTYTAMARGDHSGGDVKAGLTMALEALLASPQFLYRHELGSANPDNPALDADAFELSSYEMATFLAYTFTGSTPDAALLAAAARDELRDPSQILAQATRLAGQAQPVMNAFVGSWLGTQDLAVAAKDEEVWPGFTALVPHMQAEINATFGHIMLDPAQSFADLYGGNFTFLNQTLAEHYGVPGVSGDALRKVATSDRGGVLVGGAFMARWGEAVESSPILRSVRVRRRLLCQDQPDPPAGTFEAREQKLAEMSEFLQDPETTNRMKYHRLTEDAPCTNCHLQYINPLGFGMEDFDTVGRVRERDLNGNPIDASGELYAPLRYSDIDQMLSFTGAKELGGVLANLESAQACLPKQMFRYVTGVGHDEIDGDNPEGAQLSELERAGYACEIEALRDSLMNDSPRAMLERFALLDAVRYRKAWSREGAQ